MTSHYFVLQDWASFARLVSFQSLGICRVSKAVWKSPGFKKVHSVAGFGPNKMGDFSKALQGTSS